MVKNISKDKTNKKMVESKRLKESESIRDSALELAWDAACRGKIDRLKMLYDKGFKPNQRYKAFNRVHSLIMGALRNGEFDTVDFLKSQGETIRKDEVAEYKKVMAEKVYEDDVTRSAMDEAVDTDSKIYYTIKSVSEDGEYYLVKNWRGNKALWVNEDRMFANIGPDWWFVSPSRALASLKSLLKVMPEYLDDVFSFVNSLGEEDVLEFPTAQLNKELGKHSEGCKHSNRKQPINNSKKAPKSNSHKLKEGYSDSVVTDDISDFGARELALAVDLLNAAKNGYPEDFDTDGVKLFCNRNSGYVFLSNSQYQVCMEADGELYSYHSLPYSGIEGFSWELYDEWKEGNIQEEEDIEYLIQALKVDEMFEEAADIEHNK